MLDEILDAVLRVYAQRLESVLPKELRELKKVPAQFGSDPQSDPVNIEARYQAPKDSGQIKISIRAWLVRKPQNDDICDALGNVRDEFRMKSLWQELPAIDGRQVTAQRSGAKGSTNSDQSFSRIYVCLRGVELMLDPSGLKADPAESSQTKDLTAASANKLYRNLLSAINFESLQNIQSHNSSGLALLEVHAPGELETETAGPQEIEEMLKQNDFAATISNINKWRDTLKSESAHK